MEKPATGRTGGVATNRYEELVWAHQTQANDIHMSGIFMPWHRYYMSTFHKLLREECSYAAPMPWWDETKDAGNFAGSGLFTSEYFGSIPEVTQAGLGTCIQNGVSSPHPRRPTRHPCVVGHLATGCGRLTDTLSRRSPA